MSAAYDSGNVFARILRAEIPCTKLHEDEHSLAFADIAPAAPVHIVVIPKAPYRDFTDFSAQADPAQQAAFWAVVSRLAKAHCAGQFRLITNNGAEAGQSVFHFHVHILGGAPLGALIGQ